MKLGRLHLFSVCILTVGLAFLGIGCSSNTTVNLTREDSIRIAKAISDTVKPTRAAATGIVLDFQRKGIKGKDMQPITWDEVTRWSQQWYDEGLIRDSKDSVVKGWRLDKDGFDILRANRDIEEVYLRLGKMDDGTYTVMILPMKGGALRQAGPAESGNSNENYNHLDPCPDRCPTNFDN